MQGQYRYNYARLNLKYNTEIDYRNASFDMQYPVPVQKRQTGTVNTTKAVSVQGSEAKSEIQYRDGKSKNASIEIQCRYNETKLNQKCSTEIGLTNAYRY
jgi:hypothetical protein